MRKLEVWDLYNTRDEIVKNYNRMLGREDYNAGGVSAAEAAAPFNVTPYGKGLILSKQWSF